MNAIRQAWSEGKPSIGSWNGLVTSLEAERLGRAGFDWVLLDLQHSGLHWDSIIPLIQAVELGGTRAMVRVPWNEPAEIMRAFDYGAIGVVVPMVSTPEQAAEIAGAMRYPPQGYRSNGQIRRAFATPAEANEDLVCVVMIETQDGWDNMEAIAATPGVDALIFGPTDLALTLGWPPDHIGLHPKALEAMDRLVEACDKHGKAAGTLGFNQEHVQALLEHGVRWVSYNTINFGGGPTDGETIASWKQQFTKTPA